MFKRRLQEYGRSVAAIGVLMVIALVCAAYVTVNQRLKLPFRDTYHVQADLARIPGLTPGLGQAVNVAGVRVGTITGVDLKDGHAVVKMEIERDKLPELRANAFATLVPNSPLKDLQIELRPGTPPAPVLKENGSIPTARTSPPIDSDELTNALDADTRQFFQALVSGVDTGLRGRGKDLREIFRSIGPTTEDVAKVTGALAQRRKELRRLVGNLAILSRAVGRRDVQMAHVVQSGSATVQALASEEAALRASVHKLPGTLATASELLDSVAEFSNELGPTATRLRPLARDAVPALKAAAPLVAEATPMVRTKLRPLVKELQPIGADLGPLTKSLSDVTPGLTRAFQGLTYVANELGYNPPGSSEGYLFWLAWFAHNASSFLSTEDAHGAAWRGLGVFSCEQFGAFPTLSPIVTSLTGVLPTC